MCNSVIWIISTKNKDKRVIHANVCVTLMILYLMPICLYTDLLQLITVDLRPPLVELLNGSSLDEEAE